MDVSSIANALVPLIQHILAGVLQSGGAGLFGKMREGAAIANFFMDVGTTNTSNPIITLLVDAFVNGEAGQQISEIGGQEAQLGSVLQQVGQIDQILAGTGTQGVEVKQFILALAEKVAGAAGSGFFGGGEKISAGEQQFLTQLRQSLGL